MCLIPQGKLLARVVMAANVRSTYNWGLNSRTKLEVVAPGDRLESWKEIAGYLRRDVTTVQRWEKREGMPVHRHQHDRLGSVYAFRSELDTWMAARRPATRPEEVEPPPHCVPRAVRRRCFPSAPVG